MNMASMQSFHLRTVLFTWTCSFVFNLLSTKTPRSFSAELLSKQPQACTDAGHYSLYSLMQQEFMVALVELYVVPVSLLLQLVQVPLNCSPALQNTVCFPSLVLSTNFPRAHSVPSSGSPAKALVTVLIPHGTSSGCQSIFGLF